MGVGIEWQFVSVGIWGEDLGSDVGEGLEML